jgi:site-specific recombinase XerD
MLTSGNVNSRKMTTPGGSFVTEIETVPQAFAPPAVTRRRDQNPYWVYLTRFSGESERTMRRCLDRIAAIILRQPPATVAAGLGERIPWEGIRYPHVVLLRTGFTETWNSLSHVNKHLSALRGVLRECWRLGLMTAEDYQRACDVENVKGSREPAGRNIHGDEIAELLSACLGDENIPHGIRDAAIVAVLQSTGIRRAEAAGALIERYDHGERSLRVIGKGNKERTVYFHPTAVPYLERWLAAVRERRGPVFRSVDRWGHIGTEPLTSRAIGYIVAERREQAGLPPLSTHDFRRSFIGEFIDAGGDLVQAQKLAGHASATTTAAYDRRPGRALRTAVDRLHLPALDELTAPGGDGR